MKLENQTGTTEEVSLQNAPEKRFKAGGVTATVWRATSQKGTDYFSVQIKRSYMDRENNWKTTSSFKERDIPKALVVLQKAYEYVIMQNANSSLN